MEVGDRGLHGVLTAIMAITEGIANVTIHAQETEGITAKETVKIIRTAMNVAFIFQSATSMVNVRTSQVPIIAGASLAMSFMRVIGTYVCVSVFHFRGVINQFVYLFS